MTEPAPVETAFKATEGREWDLVGIGACTWDTLVVVPEFVESGAVVRAVELVQQGGGPVATALCEAAWFGCRGAMIDRVGNGPTARLVVDELERLKVETRWLQAGAAEPARAVVQVRRRDGERAIVYFPAGDATEPEIPSDLGWDGVRVLHLNGRHDQVARRAAKAASEAGCLISFDGGGSRWREGLEPFLAAAHILVVARDFASAATGKKDPLQQLEALRQRAPRALVLGVTCGGEGAWLANGLGEPRHVPATPPARVIDTTGAGDVYHGALLGNLLQGRTLREAAITAAERAGRNCGQLGGRGLLIGDEPIPPLDANGA